MPHRLEEARHALALSEARLQFITERAEIGYWHWDVVADVLEWSVRCRRLFGVEDDAPMTYARFLGAIHPDDRESADRAVRASLAGDADGQFDTEYRTIWPDGTVHWIRSKGSATFEHGAATTLAGIALDVTDRKQAEAQLALDLEFMRRLQRLGTLVAREGEVSKLLEEIIDTAIAATGADAGHIRLIDPKDGVPRVAAHRNLPAWWLEFWSGVGALSGTTGLALARGARVVIPDVEASALFVGTPALEMQLRAGIRAVQATPLVTRDGRVLGTISTHYGRRLELDDRAAQRLDLLAREASDVLEDVRAAAELRESERELRISEERFRAFMSHGPVAAWIVDREHRIRYLSPGYRRMFGMTHVREGCSIADVVPAPIAGEYVRNNEAVFTAGEAIECIEHGVRADGSAGTFVSVKFPMRLSDGETLLGGIALDITERHRAEQALRDADRQKNAFLATLSHELRNPLAPLRTAAKLLGDPALEPDRQAWARGVIERQVGQMALLLDDLLEISRITQGKLQLRRERTDLHALVDEALETVRPLLQRKNHRLAVSLPAEPLWVDGDPLRLAQVLTNLLTNAAKYTDPHGRIELRAEAAGDELTITVEDTGIGLAPEALAAVFGMFAQIPGSRARSEGGLGIGLALAKGIVELHGGAITATSPGLGRGSAFSFTLPRAPDDSAAAASPDRSRDAREPAGRRVLVADDNRDAADAVALLLERHGHAVRVAYDGHAALALAQTFRPDAGLLDVGMPGLTGYDVARALRAQPWGRAMLLVAMTGWGQEEDKRQAHEAGFDRHLTKPVDPDRLLALLASEDAAAARSDGTA